MSYYIVQIKLPKVLNDAVDEYCRKKGLDFYEWMIAICTFGMKFKLGVRGEDRRGFRRAMGAWEDMNSKHL